MLPGVLGQFTNATRRVVVRAHDEARLLEHGGIGCEHLLLGLIREEEGVAALVFDSLDITPDRVRAQVVRTLDAGSQADQRDMPFTSQAKTALELALHEALSLHVYYVGAEHILLGLLREDEGLAERSLTLLDIDPRRLARAASEIRAARMRFALPDPARLAAYARAHVELRAAFEAKDVARASALRTRFSIARMLATPTVGSEDRALARVADLLA